MTATELREIACALNYQSWTEWRTDDENKFAQAAEVLELIAWAENNKPKWDMWRVKHAGVTYFGNTFIDTLRRAREASK